MRYSEELLFICKEFNCYKNTVRWIYKDIKTGVYYDIVRGFDSVNVSIISESVLYNTDRFNYFLILLKEEEKDNYLLCCNAPFVTDNNYSRFYTSDSLDYRHCIDLVNMFNSSRFSVEELSRNVLKELNKVGDMLRVNH